MDLTQRLELFVFQTWFKELDSYFDDSQTWSFFLELWHFFWKKNYSKNWTKFFDSKNWTLFLWIWRKELNFFSLIEYDAENWTLWKWRRELNPFSFLPQRIETFPSLPLIWLKEMKSEKMTQRVELVFFNMTYRIEPLLFSLIWFKELNFASKKETQKIEIFLEKWLKELNSL